MDRDAGEGRPRSQQLWTTNPAGSKHKHIGENISCQRMRRQKKPVGGGAVDVNHVADAVVTICFRFLMPEVFKVDVWK